MRCVPCPPLVQPGCGEPLPVLITPSLQLFSEAFSLLPSLRPQPDGQGMHSQGLSSALSGAVWAGHSTGRELAGEASSLLAAAAVLGADPKLLPPHPRGDRDIAELGDSDTSALGWVDSALPLARSFALFKRKH